MKPAQADSCKLDAEALRGDVHATQQQDVNRRCIEQMSIRTRTQDFTQCVWKENLHHVSDQFECCHLSFYTRTIVSKTQGKERSIRLLRLAGAAYLAGLT